MLTPSLYTGQKVPRPSGYVFGLPGNKALHAGPVIVNHGDGVDTPRRALSSLAPNFGASTHHVSDIPHRFAMAKLLLRSPN